MRIVKLLRSFGAGCIAASLLLSTVSSAQLRDTIDHGRDTATSGVHALRPLPTPTDIALQFLAGEAAFNATSFALWGNNLYSGSTQPAFGAGLGILASMITVPLVIYFTSDLIGLHAGSWPLAAAAAFTGFFVVNLSAPPNTRNHSYLTRYLFTSLPIVLFAQLVYDLTFK